MTTFRLPPCHAPSGSRGTHSLVSRLALGVFALAWTLGAQAFVSVGPNGTFATIQQGVAQAIANGGDEVRVQLRCFGCSYGENVDFDTSVSINLSGGWAADFQSQNAVLNSAVTGSDANAHR